MPNNNSLTWFDCLSTDIIFEIFDYLSSNDIIYTFFYFNQRFNSILLQNQCFLNNLETPTTNFYFWQNILTIIGPQIQRLVLTSIDFSFSLNLFPNLKCIIISSPLPIDDERLYSIFECEQFSKLNSFKIQRKILNQRFPSHYPGKLTRTLFKKIFNHANSLKIFECLFELILYKLEGIDNLISNINIHSLSLKLRYLIDIFSFLKYTPNLKYFNLIVTSFYHNDELKNEQNLSKIKLKKFSFTYEMDFRDYYYNNEEAFLSLINLLKQFSSSLIFLSLNLLDIVFDKIDALPFNGIKLQEQFLESMIHLKQFHFQAQLNEDLINVENILSTFKNQFWFDHNWFIGMHGRYLYTLPFHFDELNSFNDFDHVKSNNSEILNYSWTWYRVTVIHLSESYNLNLNLIKQLKMKMPNLMSIIFDLCVPLSFDTTMEDSYINENETNQINITLDSVTTVHFKDGSVEKIKQWLINILPNLKHLVLFCTNDYVPIADKRIENLKILGVRSCHELIKTGYVYFPNLQEVEIQFLFLDKKELINDALNRMMDVLASFKFSKILICHFHYYNFHGQFIPVYDMNEMVAKLNVEKILKNYQIKHCYNYFQFVKKNNE
jgi:hypothetical protein